MSAAPSGRCWGLLLVSGALVLLLTSSPAQAKPFDFSQIISTVADNVITRLYREGEIELLRHYCNYSRRPYFHRWELNYRATTSCPGWTTAVGKAQGYLNPTTAEIEATKDLVRKLVQAGLVTREEASAWL
uniref:ALF4 n=1 Tax=Procambarus clarkii TaxID=6728 RepID=A0AAN0N750_PROCL|nr:anti-lipopolysaccharide factor-like [Procambarus clarkii]